MVFHLRAVPNKKPSLPVMKTMRADAEFKESDHPRDADGKFGSGGGSKSKSSPEEPVSLKEKGTPAFISSFIKENPTQANMEEALKSRDSAHLHKVLEMIEKHGSQSAGTQMVKSLTEKELKSRGE